MDGVVKGICAVCALIVVIIMAFFGMQSFSHSALHDELVEKNNVAIAKLLEGRSVPVLTNSLDFENAKKRYEILNSRGRIGWIYIFTAEGALLLEAPVMGKLTSSETYITPMEEIKRSRASSDDQWEYFTVEMSDLDGTYGVNADSVFWFDPDGVFYELPLTSPIVIYSTARKQYDATPLFTDFTVFKQASVVG